MLGVRRFRAGRGSGTEADVRCCSSRGRPHRACSFPPCAGAAHTTTFYFQETAHTTIPTVTRSHLDFLALAAPESKTTNTAQKVTETKWSTARTGTKDFKG